jgi:hypothetical protein
MGKGSRPYGHQAPAAQPQDTAGQRERTGDDGIASGLQRKSDQRERQARTSRPEDRKAPGAQAQGRKEGFRGRVRTEGLAAWIGDGGPRSSQR